MTARPRCSLLTSPVTLGAAAVVAAGAFSLPFADPGPLSDQMVQHLALMNVAAPLLALGLSRGLALGSGPGVLLGSGVVQIALLWSWHAPALQGVAAGSAPVHLVLLLGLGAASLVFWSAVLRESEAAPWRAIVALLVTGKLACLLGALLIFAPRDLYALPGLVFALCSSGESSLADQQLAGLLMVTACPLSFLTSGVAIAARMLSDLERRTARVCAPASLA
jgi:putative membrane protein